MESSDCRVPLWFFSTDYLTSVLASVKRREKYLLAPGEASFALVPASNVLLPSEEGFCKCKVSFLLAWVGVRTSVSQLSSKQNSD